MDQPLNRLPERFVGAIGAEESYKISVGIRVLLAEASCWISHCIIHKVYLKQKLTRESVQKTVKCPKQCSAIKRETIRF